MSANAFDCHRCHLYRAAIERLVRQRRADRQVFRAQLEQLTHERDRLKTNAAKYLEILYVEGVLAATKDVRR